MTNIEKAFVLGIMVTREGFNGECLFDHLAPDKIRPDQCSEYYANSLNAAIETWMAEAQDNIAVQTLLKELNIIFDTQYCECGIAK